jgi:hypothetical protein
VFLRWAAEMNGNWYAWSGSRNGNDPAGFVRAWRHIHDIFRSVGATNVLWVWAPNADSHPGGTARSSGNNWRHYYPGDRYVDWVGIDGYNWGDGGGNEWESFGRIFSPVYQTYAERKPIMIAETASVNGPGGSKAEWLRAAARWIRGHRDIRALIYFDTNDSSSGIDWRIDSTPAALSAFRSLAGERWFGGRAFSRGLGLPAAARLRNEMRR